MDSPAQMESPNRWQTLRDELDFWRFLIPRETVQLAGRHLPLEKLRDLLPKALRERLRFGLYPARVSDPLAVICAREHPPWGIPAQLDPQKPLHFVDPPRVSILMVTYGNWDLTALCLASLQRLAGSIPFELIVVDNSSPDDTPQRLKELEQSALLPMRVVLNRHNLGFAAANNQAARLARGDVLVLLNNDTIVTEDWLPRLLAVIDEDPQVAMVGPRTNSCGNEAALGTPYATVADMFAFAKRYTDAHRGGRKEPDMLTLFCTAIRTSVWQEVGGLDEGYGLGMFEDDDLTMAVRRCGHKVLLCEDAYVHHFGGAAFGKLPPRKYLRLFFHNRRYFERKWHTEWKKR